jgi:hypothetical protein
MSSRAQALAGISRCFGRQPSVLFSDMTARKEILAQAKRDKRMTKLARRQKSKAVATNLGIDEKLTSRVN